MSADIRDRIHETPIPHGTRTEEEIQKEVQSTMKQLTKGHTLTIYDRRTLQVKLNRLIQEIPKND